MKRKYFNSEYDDEKYLQADDDMMQDDGYMDDDDAKYYAYLSGVQRTEREHESDRKKNEEENYDVDNYIDEYSEKEAEADEDDSSTTMDEEVRKHFSLYNFKDIMEDYHSGDEKRRQKAMEDAIYAMEGVVRSIIKKRYSTYTAKHYYDLDQSGKLGVIKALERFDATKGAASTFFYSYIVHEMQMYIDTFVNRTTSHYSANIRKIKKAIANIQKYKSAYTAVDIAQETGLTMETVEQSLAILTSTTEVHYDNCTDAFLNQNAVATKKMASPEEEYIRTEQEQAITLALRSLPELQRKVLTLSFGIEGDKDLSHKEISRRLSVPIDKVKKAYADGLRNLRYSNLRKVFNDYIEYDEKKASQGEITMTGIQDIFKLLDDNFEIEGDFSDC